MRLESRELWFRRILGNETGLPWTPRKWRRLVVPDEAGKGILLRSEIFCSRRLDGRQIYQIRRRVPHPTPPRPYNAIRLRSWNPSVSTLRRSSRPMKLLPSKGKGTIGLDWWYAWGTERLGTDSGVLLRLNSSRLDGINIGDSNWRV